jgi:hypothetical protein
MAIPAFGQHPFHQSLPAPQRRGNPLDDRADRFAVVRDDSLILMVRTSGDRIEK